jgi:NADPH2:quinone reductase
MRAAVLRELGKLPRVEEFPEPTPGDGEVLIHVKAAALKPVDIQMASGKHYASPRELPVICGSDGAGRLDDGGRVFFGGPRRPYGSMAERTVVRKAQCLPIPETVNDETAAAITNPGISAWLSLTHAAKLKPGETVLILGATGVTGRLALQIARVLGARRVVAAGRNRATLASLHELGADATIPLDCDHQELIDAFRREAGQEGFDVIIDYLWGLPIEALLAAIAKSEFAVAGPETRLLQVGESAGPTITLPAAVLRSAALTIRGTAGIPPWDALAAAFDQVMNGVASGLLRIEVERISLADIEGAWERDLRGSRPIVIP